MELRHVLVLLVAVGCGGSPETQIPFAGTGAGAGVVATSSSSSAGGSGGAAATTTGSGGAGGASSSSSGAICSGVTDCPAPASACETSICVGGVCGSLAVDAGTVLAEQVPGDCQELSCDGAGHVETSPDASDLPDDGNVCTEDSCAAGAPVFTMRPVKTPCASDGGNICDGGGHCIGCIDWSDCPGETTDCKYRKCDNHLCGTTYVPAGPTLQQVEGDCLTRLCDGSGTILTTPDASDVLDDGLECTVEACGAAGPTHDPKATGTPCSQGDGNLCDEGAVCVEYIPFACDTNGNGVYPVGTGNHHQWFVAYTALDGLTYQCNEGPCYCKTGNLCKAYLGAGNDFTGTCQPVM